MKYIRYAVCWFTYQWDCMIFYKSFDQRAEALQLKSAWDMARKINTKAREQNIKCRQGHLNIN